jgi:hypothetical protein
MHIRNYFTDHDGAAPGHTETATRSNPAAEKMPQEAAGSYNRALAGLIVAIADITSGAASTSPPRRGDGIGPAVS